MKGASNQTFSLLALSLEAAVSCPMEMEYEPQMQVTRV